MEELLDSSLTMLLANYVPSLSLFLKKLLDMPRACGVTRMDQVLSHLHLAFGTNLRLVLHLMKTRTSAHFMGMKGTDNLYL